MKQAVAFWFRFPAWVQFFVSDVTWSVCAPSGNLCCVTSPGKLSSAVVAPWCYGIGTVLDFINGWFSRWESSGPARVGGRSFAEFQRCSSHVRESQSARREERASAPLARRFKQTNLALPTGGLSNPIVRMGRSPPPHVQAFWGWNLRGPTFQSFRGRYKLTDFICLFSHTWC